MKKEIYRTLRGFFGWIFVIAVIGTSAFRVSGADLSPTLAGKLSGLADDAGVGLTIVAFETNEKGLQESHLNILRSIGITAGETFPNLGMVAMPLTAGQVRALADNAQVRSIWSNDRMYYYMEEARILTGADKMEIDRDFMARNGGLPVSGDGNFTIMVIDSGVDATHEDLKYGPKVIQNVQTAVAAGTVQGFTPNVSIENVPNTDQTVGHGTHCAGIIGGTGVRSGGRYRGVAPGAKIIGSGLGAALFVINGLSAWEWGLANQYRYNIKVISNSYGSAGRFNPNNPIMIASKKAYDRGITSVFAGANSGPAKGTFNQYAKAPWVIGVAAGSKEGMLADFSSRGLPREERLNNADPLDDFDAPTITAPGTGRVFESFKDRFTTDIVSTRATSNLTSNGLTADADLPPGMIPFYTQISGTSMATPFVAGTIALMLDADPTLTPDEIKQIITETATRMPGYEDFEVGAGYLNVYAAVDKVFNRGKEYKNYQSIDYNLQFGEERQPEQAFNINFNPAATPGPNSPNSRTFTVAPGMNVLDIYATAEVAGESNLVGLVAFDPDGKSYSSGIELPVLGSTVRQIIVENPKAGAWRLEVRGARGLTAVPGASLPTSGAAAPGPVEGTVSQIKYILPTIADIQGHQSFAEIDFALKNRLIDTYEDGSFRPDQLVSRGDFAYSLLINTNLRQTVGAWAKFSDITGDLAKIAESITTKGSTIRDYGFDSTGMMTANGAGFDPAANINRLDVAVAFVKALGHDAKARSLAGSTVTFNGAPLSDNAQIPSNLRGYVQLAIDKGLFEAFPAEVRRLPNGTFQALPGPRFEPGTNLDRANLAKRLKKYRELFTTGG